MLLWLIIDIVIQSDGDVQFLLTPMGFLAPRSAHSRPSALPPFGMIGDFLAYGSADSPQTLISHIQSFGTLQQLFKIPPMFGQKCHIAGGNPIFLVT
jgi:hypothetical protein